MKVLITGAGGMLGSDLVQELKSHCSLVGVGLSPKPHLAIPFYVEDLARRGEISNLFQRENPEVVFHLAAMTDVDGCEKGRYEAFEKNLEATKGVAEASEATDALLIFVSTDYVFDGQKRGEYTEEDPPHPLNVYGETKLLAENYLLRHSKRTVIFRTSWLYGFYGRSFPRTLLQQARTQKRFCIVGDQYGRPTYTRDLAKIFTHLLLKERAKLEQAAGEIFHVAGEEPCSWAEFARGIFRTARLEGVAIEEILSTELNRPALRPKNSILSTKKFEETFGLKVRGWKQALPGFLSELSSKEQIPT